MAQDMPRFGNKYTKNLIKYGQNILYRGTTLNIYYQQNMRYVLYRTDVILQNIILCTRARYQVKIGENGEYIRERMPIVARRFCGVRCAERIGANCRVNTLSDYCKSIIGVAECTVYLSCIFRISIVYLSYINRENTVVSCPKIGCVLS